MLYQGDLVRCQKTLQICWCIYTNPCNPCYHIKHQHNHGTLLRMVMPLVLRWSPSHYLTKYIPFPLLITHLHKHGNDRVNSPPGSSPASWLDGSRPQTTWGSLPAPSHPWLGCGIPAPAHRRVPPPPWWCPGPPPWWAAGAGGPGCWREWRGSLSSPGWRPRSVWPVGCGRLQGRWSRQLIGGRGGRCWKMNYLLKCFGNNKQHITHTKWHLFIIFRVSMKEERSLMKSSIKQYFSSVDNFLHLKGTFTLRSKTLPYKVLKIIFHFIKHIHSLIFFLYIHLFPCMSEFKFQVLPSYECWQLQLLVQDKLCGRSNEDLITRRGDWNVNKKCYFLRWKKP